METWKTIHLPGQVGDDHRLVLELPPEVEAGRVEVQIRVPPAGPSIDGYSIQGMLCELHDPGNPGSNALLLAEVDTFDGHHWLCELPHEVESEEIRQLWRSEVAVTGKATFGGDEPRIEATSIRPIVGFDDPAQALRELAAACAGPVPDETAQAFMDRIRERD